MIFKNLLIGFWSFGYIGVYRKWGFSIILMFIGSYGNLVDFGLFLGRVERFILIEGEGRKV